MKIGKLTSEELDEIIFSQIQHTRPEVLSGAKVGFDCAELDFGGDSIVLSTDPITAAQEDVGRLFVNVCSNDVSAAGAENVAMIVTMLIPPEETKENVKKVFSSVAKRAGELNIAIIGGHTEVTPVVSRILLCGTAVGRKKKIPVKTVCAGDILAMSKYAAMEGTGILALERADELKSVLSKEELSRAVALLDEASVQKEGTISAKAGAVFMHDATEGGVLGAAHEVAQALGMGVEIFAGDIPMLNETKKISEFFSLDPLRLISSGVLLIAIKKEDFPSLQSAFKEADIPLAKIGVFNENGEKTLVEGDKRGPLLPPMADEIYKVE